MPDESAIFSAETLRFLRGLKAHNDREWFQARKAEYESAVKAPILAFASVLSDSIATFAPDYATPPEKAVQRIYRDVRFSADKTPYRTELGILFTHRSLGKKAGSGVYVSIGAESSRVAGGLYQADTPGLYAVRQHLADHYAEFQKLLSAKPIREAFGTMTGESLKRPPRGFAPDHPAMPLLMHTQWLLDSTLQPEAIVEPGFVRTVTSRVKALLPFVRFFENPLLEKAKPVILD